MTYSIKRRSLVTASIAALIAVLVVPTASAATPPEVRVLQRQVRTLTAQVATLRSQVNTLRTTVGEVASTATAANTAAASAGQNATAAVTKTNCLVSGVALSLWNNDVYFDGQGLFTATGLDVAGANDPVAGYVAGVNASCVPSVFPRSGRSAFRAFAMRLSEGALLHPR